MCGAILHVVLSLSGGGDIVGRVSALRMSARLVRTAERSLFFRLSSC